jgi:hypothetical protein
MELDAKEWIFGNSDYFQKICHMARIEPGFVIKITKEAIKLNCQKVEFIREESENSAIPVTGGGSCLKQKIAV